MEGIDLKNGNGSTVHMVWFENIYISEEVGSY